VNLLLQSYVTITGSVYNPDPAAGGAGNLFTNNGAGAYTITLNGVPEPACGNPGGNTTPCPTKSLDIKSFAYASKRMKNKLVTSALNS
jgi:hypothetical protein